MVPSPAGCHPPSWYHRGGTVTFAVVAHRGRLAPDTPGSAAQLRGPSQHEAVVAGEAEDAAGGVRGEARLQGAVRERERRGAAELSALDGLRAAPRGAAALPGSARGVRVGAKLNYDCHPLMADNWESITGEGPPTRQTLQKGERRGSVAKCENERGKVYRYH